MVIDKDTGVHTLFENIGNGAYGFFGKFLNLLQQVVRKVFQRFAGLQMEHVDDDQRVKIIDIVHCDHEGVELVDRILLRLLMNMRYPDVQILQNLAPDLGVSLYWRRLLHDPIVSIPRYGIINTHASLLPRYRGFAATSWAILKGDKEVGLTVHQVSPGIADDGDILEQEIIPIDESTTIHSLFEIINKRSNNR